MDAVFRLEAYDSFRMVTEEILRNLHRSSKVPGAEIDNSVTDAAKDDLRKMILKNNFDIDLVTEQIKNNDWDTNRVEYFILLLKENKNDVLHSIIIHHNRSYTDTLVEFDWLLKLVLGSSESKSLRFPMLQVILSSVNSSGNQKQRLYELNKESLGKLINILEDYQKGVDDLI